MLEKRIIPVLLLQDGGLVKTTKFENAKYVGDPINTVKIFNDKEVDELIVLDIEASKKNLPPNFELLEVMANEAFMPMGYGGGIHSLEHIEKIFKLGFEKVTLNSENFKSMELLKEASEKFGSQSIVASVDLKKSWLGKWSIYDHRSGKTLSYEVKEYIRALVQNGAGEIFLNFVNRDGTMSGYELEYFSELANLCEVPMICCGGAASKEDLKLALIAGADAAAAGALFVYHGPHRAVLINYPKRNEIEEMLNSLS